MKDTRRLFVGLASLGIAALIFHILAGCPPTTAACFIGALSIGIAAVYGTLVLIFFVDYREAWFFLRWKLFWFRRPGGPYPFPETKDERIFQRPWAGITLAKFAEWTFDTERERETAGKTLQELLDRPAQVAQAFEGLPDKPPLEAADAVESGDNILKARSDYNCALREERKAKRDYHRLYCLFLAMEMYPPDIIDPEETFRVNHRPLNIEHSDEGPPGYRRRGNGSERGGFRDTAS